MTKVVENQIISAFFLQCASATLFGSQKHLNPFDNFGEDKEAEELELETLKSFFHLAGKGIAAAQNNQQIIKFTGQVSHYCFYRRTARWQYIVEGPDLQKSWMPCRDLFIVFWVSKEPVKFERARTKRTPAHGPASFTT